MLYVSGLRGLDPQEQLATGGPEAETRQVLENLKQILETVGASLESVVKTTIYLSDIKDFKTVNSVYGEYFPSDCPARSTYQVGRLPVALGLMVPLLEIDAIAYVGNCATDFEDGSPVGPCTCNINMTPNKSIKSAKSSIHSDTERPSQHSAHAVLFDNTSTIYVSAVLGCDLEGQLVCGGCKEQTRQVIRNLERILERGRSSLKSVLKVTLYMADIRDYKFINQVYMEYFTEYLPAQTALEASHLPMDAYVSLDAIALSGDVVVADAGPCECTRV